MHSDVRSRLWFGIVLRGTGTIPVPKITHAAKVGPFRPRSAGRWTYVSIAVALNSLPNGLYIRLTCRTRPIRRSGAAV